MIGNEPFHCQLSTAAEAETIFTLLTETAARLHEKQIRQWIEPWDKELLLEDIQCNFAYLCFEQGRLQGVFFLKPATNNAFQPAHDKNFLYLYHVAVHPDLLGKGKGKNLVFSAQHIADAEQKNIYMDCWAGNGKLIEFYQRTGFQSIGIFSENDYQIHVFRYPCKPSKGE